MQQGVMGAQRRGSLHCAGDRRSRLALEHDTAEDVLGIQDPHGGRVLVHDDRGPSIGGAQHGDRGKKGGVGADGRDAGLHRG